MTTLLLLLAAPGAGLAGFVVWRRYRKVTHDPVEYFGSWDGYGLPLRLTHKITKDEADARNARGSAYLIGYFDSDGRLVRDVKIYRDRVFFEHFYTYYPSGRLKGMQVTNTSGEVTVRAYGESDRPTFVW
jgi:Family of unknown function (DUF6156)